MTNPPAFDIATLFKDFLILTKGQTDEQRITESLPHFERIFSRSLKLKVSAPSEKKICSGKTTKNVQCKKPAKEGLSTCSHHTKPVEAPVSEVEEIVEVEVQEEIVEASSEDSDDEISM